MTEFYHVSRRDISSLGEFSLTHFSGNISSEGMHTAEEFTAYKELLYPNGLSSHGEIYLHNPFKSTGPNLGFTQNEYFLETVFELVRRLKFPTFPPRFTSVFGCLTLEDAQKIRHNVFKGAGSIYKVACDEYIKVDMEWVRQVASVIGIQIVAEKYWSGQPTSKPFWEVLMIPPVGILERID